MKKIFVLIATTLVLAPPAAGAQIAVDGVLSVTPVLEHACLAAEFRLESGEQLAGIRWYHNDQTVAFPRLLLMEAPSSSAPDVSHTSLVLATVTAASLDWGEVMLEQPVTSSTGIVHAVFELPEGAERSGAGTGQGPGIGYVANSGPRRAYLSPDGIQWIEVRKDFALAVEPIVVMGRGIGSGSLAAWPQQRPTGWWTEARTPRSEDDSSERAQETLSPALASAERPVVATPNPFNPRVTLSYYAATTGRAEVSVYDLRGRRVAVLVNGPVSAGEHTVIWEGVDEARRPVASGVYFVRAQLPGVATTVRIALIR